MPRPGCDRRLAASAALVVGLTLLVGPGRGSALGQDDLGLKVAPGFHVRLYSDESVANDIYAMTLDGHGRVVVTGRGYIRTLHGDPGQGRATGSSEFGATVTGGMGLCFVGDDLWFCGDGWLSRYRDVDGDGKADGPPERAVPMVFTEHGGHAIRKGPDGFLYVIGGNDSGINARHVADAASPVTTPEAGGVLRLSPDGKRCEVLAHGFRNPYDFDFNPAGDLFTYDSDVERDAFLPWYAPTRLYHVAPGGHHGWRLTGYLRSWPRPASDPGTVPLLAPVGRGSPTGVACYRHVRFPERYRGGLFFLDWTFGKLYFTPLKPDGATYESTPEVFLEPTGTLGFAPTDLEVAPDGALLVSIGGRGTRGAVYRIDCEGGDAALRAQPPPADDLERVLRAPQPLDAWSRNAWEPVARRLGASAFVEAAGDARRESAQRVRAVEVVTDLLGGFTPDAARRLARAEAPSVRARVAWSVGRALRAGTDGAEAVLVGLAGDSDARVRLAALEARESWGKLDAEGALPWRALLAAALDDPDPRVRQAVARLAGRAGLKQGDWDGVEASSAQSRLTALLAELLGSSGRGVNEPVALAVLDVLRSTREPGQRLQGLRLLVRALGDYRWFDPEVEVWTAYSLASDVRRDGPIARKVCAEVLRVFPTGDAVIDDESARLLAMLEDDDPRALRAVADFWTKDSTAGRDLHALIVASRLRAPRDPKLTSRTAHALVDLDRKLDGQAQRIKQTWNDRLAEVSRQLLLRDESLGRALLAEPDLLRPANAVIALALGPDLRKQAARKFLAAWEKSDERPASAGFIDLLDALPPAESRPVYRQLWGDQALRDALVARLARSPDAADRGRFLEALGSTQPDSVVAALGALQALPPSGDPKALVSVVRLLRRQVLEPRAIALRRSILQVIEREAGRRFEVQEPSNLNDAAALRTAYRPVLAWFESAHPAEAAEVTGTANAVPLSRRLAEVDWSKGDAARGARLFESKGCRTCHTGVRSLGPDLTGVGGRFSRDDLFTAIASPSLDVAPPYRTTLVATRDGLVYSGTLVFESADGVILQTGATSTVRVATPDIAERRPGDRSLMPDNLLDGLAAGDLADLDAYLRSLQPAARTVR